MIFVNGLQRTGTNFATSLFDNCTNWCWPYWKHTIKYESIDPKCDKVYCIIKNPYSWIESICVRDCVDIIAMYGHTYKLQDQNNHFGKFQLNVQRLCWVYKLFYTSWLNYEKTELIKYEDLLIKHKNSTNTLVPQSGKWDPKRIKPYLKYEAPLVPIPVKNIISKTLGKEFFDLIGYSIK